MASSPEMSANAAAGVGSELPNLTIARSQSEEGVGTAFRLKGPAAVRRPASHRRTGVTPAGAAAANVTASVVSGDPRSPTSKREDPEGQHRHAFQFAALLVGAAGVVFGDIGTSPLYTFAGIFIEVLDDSHPSPADIVDAFSMVFWSLTFVVGFKYVSIVMRISHHGEGGAFAMLHNIYEGAEASGFPLGPRMQGLVAFLTMLAVSFIAGDGCITPAISVLSALEGIPVEMSQVSHVLLAVAILLFIFMMQRRGSMVIGSVAGPVMICWLLSIGALGVHNLMEHPEAAKLVLKALNPSAIFTFWTRGNFRGTDAWRSLAGVVLSVTGAEALYADMGHFGAGPISAAWFTLVYPCLVLQYMGQAAALCVRPEGVSSPFYNAVPDSLQWPMVVLATLAAIIASQAMISGLFSLLTQAYAMRFMPRIKVLHTNPNQQGQVYIPEVNWALCALCLVITISFQTSGRLAGAYGITVTSTFLVTTALLGILLRCVRHWSRIATFAAILPLFIVDAAFWSANVLKILESGWVPVVISIVLCFFMHVHRWGHKQEELVMQSQVCEETEELRCYGSIENTGSVSTIAGLQAVLRSSPLMRTDKVVVFLTPHEWRVPRTVGALATLLGCLPKTIVLLSIRFADVPFIAEASRSTCEFLSDGIFSLTLHFGYAETLVAEELVVQRAVAEAARKRCGIYPGLEPLVALDEESADAVESKRHQPKGFEVNESLGTIDTAATENDAEMLTSHSVVAMEEGAAPGAAASGETIGSGSSSSDSRRRGLHRGRSLNSSGGPGSALRGTPTFVVSKVRYATLPEMHHGLLTRIHIFCYRFMQLNARSSMTLLGLKGEDTLEVSVVRFL